MKILDNKKYKDILFLMCIFVICTFSLYQNKLYVGQDTLFHMNRLQGIVNAFQDHQILPSIYPYTNNGFGYASPLFYCDLLLYPFAILYWLGIPLVSSYRLLLIFYYGLSILSIFYVSKHIFGNTTATYLTTILYSFNNYHLWDQYFRNSLGELLAIVFIPLVILSCYKLFVEKKNVWILLGISFSLLLISHVLSFVLYCFLFFIFLIVFLLDNRKDFETIKLILINIIKAIVLALLLTAFYLFPMIEQLLSQKFYCTGNMLYNLKDFIIDFSHIFEPFTNITTSSSISGFYYFTSGLVFEIVPLVYFYLIKKNKSNKIINIIFVVSYIFLILSFGYIPFIDKLEFINIFQFPFRFNIIAFPLLSFVIAYICTNVKHNKILIIIIVLYSLTNSILIQNTSSLSNDCFVYDYQTQADIYDTSLITMQCDRNTLEISGGEYLPITLYTNYNTESDFIKTTNGDEYVEIYNDELDEFLPYTRNGTSIQFEYISNGNELLMMPLTYYKGYSAYAADLNGNRIKLDVVSPEKYKQVSFKSLEGDYTYVCHYDGTLIQHISLFVSILTIILLIIYQIIINKKCH